MKKEMKLVGSVLSFDNTLQIFTFYICVYSGVITIFIITNTIYRGLRKKFKEKNIFIPGFGGTKFS